MKILLLTFTIVSLSATLGFASEKPILIAHRGLQLHAPENTLPAFISCLELGMGFELDIRTTQDGRLVVLHDTTLGRTTDGPDRPVSEMTWNQIRELDAGSWFDSRFTGVRIPTLEETFALIQEHKRGRTMIALNVKQITKDGEKELVRLVEKYGPLEESFMFDQSRECSHRLKAINPRVRIGQNVNRDSLASRLEEDFLDVFLFTFVPTSEEVALPRAQGRQVLYNYAGVGENRRNEESWKRVRELGIDGMLTDYPLECAELWRE